MHANEFAIDDGLVRGLIGAQFPRWSELPLRRIRSSGTVHAIYRLGSEFAVRLPRAAQFTAALEREAAILPILGPRLPISIPELAAVGEPTDTYPSAWSVLRWIDGESMATAPVADPKAAANRLGSFVASMWDIDAAGETSMNQRGQPMAFRDEWTRQSIAAVADEFDPSTLTELWENALAEPPWDGVKKWIHGDLLPGNLLVANGGLTAVIDFGECAIGNPTCDLIAGWWVFDAAGREAFREASGAATASWSRARGTALSGAIGALSYYRESNPEFADQARQTVRNVMDDV